MLRCWGCGIGLGIVKPLYKMLGLWSGFGACRVFIEAP